MTASLILKSKKHFLAIGFVVFMTLALKAQIGGKYSFAFLRMHSSARLASSEGTLFSLQDSDATIATQNHALLNEKFSNTVITTYTPYSGGIHGVSAHYFKSFEKWGNFRFGLHNINYGKLVGRNSEGVEENSFYPNETAIGIAFGRKMHSRFRIGGAYHLAFSQMHRYNALATAVDINGHYYSKDGNFQAAFGIYNLGWIIQSYRFGDKGKLPLNVQLGCNYRFNHAPFRVAVLMHDLQSWNLDYFDANAPNIERDPISGEPIKSVIRMDNLFRHFNLGLEVRPVTSFFVNLSFDYNRRKSFSFADRGALTGFALGAGMDLKKYQFHYALVSNGINTFNNYITIGIHLSKFRKKE